jgi:DNA-binding response OmpR family regulator
MKKKIYIVDDDKNIVESLTIVLEASDFEVTSQYNEEDLINNLNSYNPDLIILDVMFPEDKGAGFQMGRDIRDNEKTLNTPIFMLSAINEKGVYAGTFSNKDRDSAWLPVNEFIEKPISPEQLLRQVNTYLA